MILDMKNIYIKYLDQDNKTDKKHGKIRICALQPEQ